MLSPDGSAAGLIELGFCDAIPYALETGWLAGAAGFEPLHLRIGIRPDSQLGAGEVEHAHLD